MSDGETTIKYDRDACLQAFAAEMQREATRLEREIKAEEERSGRHNPSDVAYPMLARALRQRHDNVARTLGTLQAAMAAPAAATEGALDEVRAA
jgi:hypothetical protein